MLMTPQGVPKEICQARYEEAQGSSRVRLDQFEEMDVNNECENP